MIVTAVTEGTVDTAVAGRILRDLGLELGSSMGREERTGSIGIFAATTTRRGSRPGSCSATWTTMQSVRPIWCRLYLRLQPR